MKKEIVKIDGKDVEIVIEDETLNDEALEELTNGEEIEEEK